MPPDSTRNLARPPDAFSRAAGLALAEELRRRTRAEVRFDNGSRALYATDASNYRQVPIGVVVPRSIDDVVNTFAVCRAHGAPILARGGGTSLAGQCCNVAVVIDCSKYLNGITALDPDGRTATVEPGCVLDTLRDAAERHHLTFGPDPSTHNHNTLGGMIGNNSCGVHSVMSGRTADNVHELDILTYDGLRLTVGETSEEELQRKIAAGGREGEIYGRLKALRDRYGELVRRRFPKIPRRVSGYNLDELLPENGFNVARALVGSEGTCVFVLGAKLRLVPSPPARTLVVLGYPDVYSAGDHVPDVLAYKPVGLEGLGELLVEHMKKKHMYVEDLDLLPPGKGWLMAEFGGQTREDADARARAMMEDLRRRPDAPTMKLYDDKEEEAHLWEVRKAGLGATARVPGEPDTWEGWEDSAVPPDRVGPYLRDLRALLDRYGYHPALYGHFGDGCIHMRVAFDMTSRAGIDKYKGFVSDAADLVLSYGGSLSGEHGDGQSRGWQLEKMFGPELMHAFHEFKHIWDPDDRMNPGKQAEADAPDAHLRLGAGFAPWEPETAFAFKDDDGKFSRAALRCVGVGECRRHGGAVMCPSYMATGEEMHSTRGRARLLFEMLHGDPLEKSWRNEPVREALDLCLACKGCKSDCPLNVDMASYKAEFFHHYYAGRVRPREAYSMGLIYWWCRIAAAAPSVANALAGTAFAKWVGGIAPQRRMPAFAARTFRSMFARSAARPHGRPKVLLFPDTFTNYFNPEIAMSAVRVLDAAGFDVTIPERPLCCGRPLYAWGMFDQARKQIGTVLDTLAGALSEGIPVVGLEPACVSAFHDEIPQLFPDDERAQRLKERSFLLDEFLLDQSAWRPRTVERRALVHAHCHHHAVLGFGGEKRMLEALGLDFEILPSGCCGMAGSFGFEREHYDIAMKAGERVLLPAVRQADADKLIIADGFSCREQIAQGTGRRALHIAQVLADAIGKEAPHG